MLHKRTAKILTKEDKVSVWTVRGCPRGFLSPLISSLVIDELLTNFDEQGTECQGYADDIVIMTEDYIEETLCNIVQR